MLHRRHVTDPNARRAYGRIGALLRLRPCAKSCHSNCLGMARRVFSEDAASRHRGAYGKYGQATLHRHLLHRQRAASLRPRSGLSAFSKNAFAPLICIDAIFLPDAQKATLNRRPTPELQVSKRQMPLSGKNTSKLALSAFSTPRAGRTRGGGS